MNIKLERINIHNNYPKVVEFKAEKQFRERLEHFERSVPFRTIHLEIEDKTYDDSPYQICIGQFKENYFR